MEEKQIVDRTLSGLLDTMSLHPHVCPLERVVKYVLS
jgi:hypothetical protein